MFDCWYSYPKNFQYRFLLSSCMELNSCACLNNFTRDSQTAKLTLKACTVLVGVFLSFSSKYSHLESFTLSLTHTHAVLHFHNHHQLWPANVLYFHNHKKVLHHPGLCGDLRQCSGDPPVGGGVPGVPGPRVGHLLWQGEGSFQQEQWPCARDQY